MRFAKQLIANPTSKNIFTAQLRIKNHEKSYVTTLLSILDKYEQKPSEINMENVQMSARATIEKIKYQAELKNLNEILSGLTPSLKT